MVDTKKQVLTESILLYCSFTYYILVRFLIEVNDATCSNCSATASWVHASQPILNLIEIFIKLYTPRSPCGSQKSKEEISDLSWNSGNEIQIK